MAEIMHVTAIEDDNISPSQLNAEQDHVYTAQLFSDFLGATVEVSTAPEPEGAHDCTQNSPTLVVDAGVPLKKSKHHTGKITEDYITDKLSRQKSFSKRLATFKSEARLLHYKCGARVYFKVVSESGKLSEHSYPPQGKRNVKTQTIDTTIETQGKSTRNSSGSPKKVVVPVASVTKPSKEIKSLPGKSSKAGKTTPIKKTFNKCGVCKVIYMGSKDLKFKKQVGALKAVWLRCDKDECDYWAHAICAGITIPYRKKIATKFLFPKHQ